MYVYVKSAVARSTATATPLHADAGSDQTITLPVSSVKINGSAESTAPSGSTHTWSQLAGPVQAKIAAPWSIGTDVTGLTKAGTYQFRLLIKDKYGNTSANSMYVFVKSAVSARTIGASSEATIDDPVQMANPDVLFNAAELEVKINPNPVKSDMTVWISGKAKGKTNVIIYSLTGQVLLQQEFVKDTPGTVSKTFNVSKLAAGTYIAQIIVDNKYKKAVKILKQ
jgi:hypothetical protein